MTRQTMSALILAIAAFTIAADPALAKTNAPQQTLVGVIQTISIDMADGFPSNGLRTVFFDVKTNAKSGITSGSLFLDNTAQKKAFHMNVDCLVVRSNAAYLSGVVYQSTQEADVGQTWVMKVIDNSNSVSPTHSQITGLYSNKPGNIKGSPLLFIAPLGNCKNTQVQSFLDGTLVVGNGANDGKTLKVIPFDIPDQRDNPAEHGFAYINTRD